MQLKNQVEWALHCCALLAGAPAGRFVPTKTLAAFHGVPKGYLSKALQNLSDAGILEGALGPNGGYRLAKPADEITFLDIVEAVEGRSGAFACTDIRKNNPCLKPGDIRTSACAVARVMWEADEAWRAHLRGVRLSAFLGSVTDVPSGLRKRAGHWLFGRA